MVYDFGLCLPVIKKVGEFVRNSGSKVPCWFSRILNLTSEKTAGIVSVSHSKQLWRPNGEITSSGGLNPTNDSSRISLIMSNQWNQEVELEYLSASRCVVIVTTTIVVLVAFLLDTVKKENLEDNEMVVMLNFFGKTCQQVSTNSNTKQVLRFLFQLKNHEV